MLRRIRARRVFWSIVLVAFADYRMEARLRRRLPQP